MIQGYGYIRVSGDSQSDGDGPQRQREKISKAAQEHGITIIDWFFDDAVAGKVETLDRPAFSLMWSKLSPGDTVVVESTNRLSRELFVQELAIRQARKQGVTLLSADEGSLMASNVDSKDVSSKLYRQMLGAIAEYDKDSIVLKLRAARVRVKASTGRCEGQKPYAESLQGRQALGRILELRNEGLGYDKIASHLNAELVPTKRQGTIWHGSTVNKMLASNTNLQNSVQSAC